jgi:hypothetical protein
LVEFDPTVPHIYPYRVKRWESFNDFGVTVQHGWIDIITECTSGTIASA